MATPININDRIKQFLLKKLMAEQDPRLVGNRLDRQAGKEDLATMGRAAAGFDEAASVMGSTPVSKQIPQMAQNFEKRAAEGRIDPSKGLGLDPKLLKYLDAAKDKKTKLTFQNKFDPATGVTKKVAVDPYTGEEIQGAPSRIVGSESYKRGRDARKDYETDPKVKKTVNIQDEYQKMVGLIKDSEKNEPSGSNDIALITTFMRFLDPDSVVRESEFIIAARAGGLLDSMLGKLNNARGQGMLTPDVRNEFKNTVNTIWRIVKEGQESYEANKYANYKGKNKWTGVAEETTDEDQDIPEDIRNMSDEELRKAAGE